VSVPAAVGSNSRSSVADCPEVSVIGVVSPDIEKPVPLTAALLTVTGPVPLEVSFTVCVEGVFSVTSPNATLLVPNVSPAVPVELAFSCNAYVSELLRSEAVSVAVSVVLTAEAVAVNPALVAPDATVTDAGTATALVLLARLTAIPPEPAALASVTVQASVPAPVSDALLHVSELSGSDEPRFR